MKILLAVDGSESSTHAATKLAQTLSECKQRAGVTLLTVHLPIPHVPRMNLVVSKESVDQYYAEECEEMIRSAKQVLEAAGVQCEVRTRIGPIAESIVEEARAIGCDYIFLGTHGRTAVASMMLGSVSARVLHLSETPVVLVR